MAWCPLLCIRKYYNKLLFNDQLFLGNAPVIRDSYSVFRHQLGLYFVWMDFHFTVSKIVYPLLFWYFRKKKKIFWVSATDWKRLMLLKV